MTGLRLSAAGGALALHALVLAALLSLAFAPKPLRRIEPVQVQLVAPPEPLPLVLPAPPPRRTAPEPPAARPRPPTPLPTPPVTPSVARPEPVRSEPPRAAPVPAPAPNALTTAPAVPDSARTVPTHADSAPAPRRIEAPAAPAGPVRSAPRIDATWSGNMPPPYPGLARRMGQQGEVRLDVEVGADGQVTDVRLRQSSGSTLLDRTAIDTVRKWRFKPATVDGQPVAEWYHDWRWVFRLEG